VSRTGNVVDVRNILMILGFRHHGFYTAAVTLGQKLGLPGFFSVQLCTDCAVVKKLCSCKMQFFCAQKTKQESFQMLTNNNTMSPSRTVKCHTQPVRHRYICGIQTFAVRQMFWFAVYMTNFCKEVFSCEISVIASLFLS